MVAFRTELKTPKLRLRSDAQDFDFDFLQFPWVKSFQIFKVYTTSPGKPLGTIKVGAGFSLQSCAFCFYMKNAFSS